MKKNELIQNRNQFSQSVKGKVPVKSEVYHFINELTNYLFPIMSENHIRDKEKNICEIMVLLKNILESYNTGLENTNSTIKAFKENLPKIYKLLIKDAIAIHEGDPASHSVEEVIICYPGFYAIVVYRIAHVLNKLSIHLIPRILTEYAHGKTGIDIHPKAKIGQSLCIDHGNGIVIGETTEIGDFVKIYQGVTLGALSVSIEHKGSKRHPTIEDNVTIYAGSTILGGKTIIGKDSIIGGNVWLTKSIKPSSLVLNQIEVRLKDKAGNELNLFK